jgi:glycosyltransferase involved in cell wall biosynthesis
MNPLTQFLGARRLRSVRPPVPAVARVAITTRPIFGPWGGANQWLLQISRYLGYCGYDVRHDLAADVDCVIINHNGLTGKMSFGLDAIAAAKKRNPRLRVIHRINDNDIRKGTGEMDAFLARHNALADHTVFISEWLRDHHARKWFDRARPHTCILNGADPAIFHPVGSQTWKGNDVSERRENGETTQPSAEGEPPSPLSRLSLTKNGAPFRFVTHHWADNAMKGFAEYAALDALIAGGELPGVELRIIGRWPADITWRAAKTFGPCAGPALAGLLRECHGYITASRWEPGGMHFIEGLQCGLPLLYHEDGGGICELGKKHGLGFREDLCGAVKTFIARYGEHRASVLAHPPSGDAMCIAYREIVQRVLAER